MRRKQKPEILLLFNRCKNFIETYNMPDIILDPGVLMMGKISIFPAFKNLREIMSRKISCKPFNIFALSLCIRISFLFPLSSNS